MKVAIVGLGRVGSTTAFNLIRNPRIKELWIIDKDKEIAEALFADFMGTYPDKGGKVKVGDYKDADDADVIGITAGVFGAPHGDEIWDLNKPIIDNIFSEIKPKKTAKIVVISTPSDVAAEYVQKITGLPHRQVIGFGGMLDANHLKYLMMKESGNFDDLIDAHFVGEHGPRGIPIFRDAVANRKQIVENTKKFYANFMAKGEASTFGTSHQLAKLIGSMIREYGSVRDISYYNEEYGFYVTWPCIVNTKGVEAPLPLVLTKEEKEEFEKLIEDKKKEV